MRTRRGKQESFSSFMKLAAGRRLRYGFCLVLIAGACALGLGAWKHASRTAARTYRIGVNQFPPYSIANPDGSFSGIAVDVLNEAARRGNVRVKWVHVVQGTPDQALLEDLVDLWPVLGVTPERKRLIHVTRPWLKNDYCLLTGNESGLSLDASLAGRKIAFPAYRMATQMAHKFLPATAVFLPSEGPIQVIQAICDGSVDAGFLESRNLDPALMKRPRGCETTTFSVHFLPGATSDAGLASTKQAAGVADDLRAQIGTMITDGSLSKIVDKWASFSAGETRSLFALQQMESRVQITLYVLLGSLLLAAVLYWQFRLARKLSQVSSRTKLLETDRNAVLEMLATTKVLSSLLEGISVLVERQYPELVCTVAARQHDSLILMAPSRLPDGMRRALGQVQIAPSGFTSAVAAFSKKISISVNLLAGAEWKPQLSEVRASGLQSCWALPVCSGSGEVTAVIAVYSKTCSRPNSQQLRLLESAVQLTGVVLERRLMDEQLQHMATHDSLTGLPNRTLLSARLQETLIDARRDEHSFAVLCIDLDRFKQINDTLGHSTGDLFLQRVCELIQGVLSRKDMVARIGGDEFIVLLREASQQAAEDMARRLLEAISKPMSVNGFPLFGSASIGISLYPQHGSTAEDLQRNADSAMYKAKEAGKARFKVFAWEMSSSGRESLAMERDLRLALEQQHFELHYQPQFLATGQLVGAEALIRFRHPQLGLIAPARFIPYAEETGLIVPIGQWVLRETCRQLAEWRQLGLTIVRTAVNVSAIQLAQPDFAKTVENTLSAHRISPSLLEIELTESAVMHSIEESMCRMQELKLLGVRLAIDDFGTGYSSLSYLQKLPVNAVKIDRSFIQDEREFCSAMPLVQAIVAASHSLGLEVVAEGVETRNQHRAVCAAGCDVIQGFLLSHPLPSWEMEKLLRSNAELFLASPLQLEVAAA